MVIASKRLDSPVSETKYEQLLAYLKQLTIGTKWPKGDVIYIPTSEIETEWVAGFSESYLGNCAAGWYLYDVQSQELWDTLLGRQYALQVTIADDVIDVGYVNRLSRFAIEQALVCWHWGRFDPEADLELEVVKRFKDVAEVQEIYTDIYLNSKRL